eukprot:TRINITY_DN23913_c0_g1_i1.p1 TRINITY_DN23913_c0_g1~~TRINITY_DN23913_c0_g1_i1.p1  ORF type:complete len:522 (-),score=125.11 TRINITY_DN23913_c0_g1_i1:21-1586(-)
MTCLLRALGALVLLVQTPVTCYRMLANCVPGSIVKDLNFTGGRIGGYTVALQALVPAFEDLKLLAASDARTADCQMAANAVNTNQLLTKDVLRAFKNLKEVGFMDSLKEGNPETNYLFVFSSRDFKNHLFFANCVFGDVVASTGQYNRTLGGKVAAYAQVLQGLMPVYADLKLIAQGNQSSCIRAANEINVGNQTYFWQMKSGKGDEAKSMREVGLVAAQRKADLRSSYLYVFYNRNWNRTWGVTELNAYRPAGSLTKKTETEEQGPSFDIGGFLSSIVKSIGSKEQQEQSFGDKKSDEQDKGQSPNVWGSSSLVGPVPIEKQKDKAATTSDLQRDLKFADKALDQEDPEAGGIGSVVKKLFKIEKQKSSSLLGPISIENQTDETAATSDLWKDLKFADKAFDQEDPQQAGGINLGALADLAQAGIVAHVVGSLSKTQTDQPEMKDLTKSFGEKTRRDDDRTQKHDDKDIDKQSEDKDGRLGALASFAKGVLSKLGDKAPHSDGKTQDSAGATARRTEAFV